MTIENTETKQDDQLPVARVQPVVMRQNEAAKIPDECGYWWLHQSGGRCPVRVIKKWNVLCVDFGGVYIQTDRIDGDWLRIH